MKTQTSTLSRRKGFTLVELIVASTLSIAVVVISAQILLTVVKVEAKNTANYNMDTQSVRFLSTFARDAQSARLITRLAKKRINMEIPRYGGDVETVKYIIKKVAGEDKRHYLRRQEVRADGSKENFDMINNIIEYDLRYFDYSKKITDEPEEVRYVQLYMQLAQTTNGKTHSRKLMTPMVMLRNKTVAN